VVCEVLEADKGVLEGILADIAIAQLFELVAERRPARVLAEHEVGLLPAHALRRHDLVGLGVLEHAILMDAGLVSEGVGANDGLVRLHREACDRLQHLRGPDQLGAVDPGPVRQPVAPHLQRHGDFFERGVTGPLTDAVDGTFDLPRARSNTAQRVGDGDPEVVVTVGGDGALVQPRHRIQQHLDQLSILVRDQIADRIGHVDRRRPGLDRGLDHLDQKIRVGAGAVLRRPFDIAGQAGCVGDRLVDRLQHGLRLHAQLVLHVHR